jgi:hypothetical protein
MVTKFMQDEQWEQLKENLKGRFTVEEETQEDIIAHTQDGEVKQGFADVLIIQTPFGRIKLARENRPVVLDKKFIYSHRAGQAARTEYTFSDTEFSHKLKVYLYDENSDGWKEIDANAILGQ